MNIKEIEARTLLRRPKTVDPWFLSRYHLNLYRGCAHNCVYCDGRAEKYAVEGEFGSDITVKTNALAVLRRELDPARRRKPLPRGFVCFGGGVGDAWQPAEEKYRLARGALEILLEEGRPVHVLTKSVLVERDLDLLTSINRRSRAIVSMSFSSVDHELSAFLEPGVPPPEQRLRVMREAKRRGLATGMFLMPVVPFLSDFRERIDEAVAAAGNHGVDFVIFGCLTLKPGRQHEYFMRAVSRRYPAVRESITGLFSRTNQYGTPPAAYVSRVHQAYFNACASRRMPVRIPDWVFHDVVEPDDAVICLLNHIDYMLGLRGKKSGLGYAAYVLGRTGRPLTEVIVNGKAPAGVNAHALRLVREIMDTGTAEEYHSLANFKDRQPSARTSENE